MVDLSKAKAGDTVVFRCGGRAVIEQIIPNGMQYVLHWAADNHDQYNYYSTTGGYRMTGPEHPFDITEVIPAPVAFDWNKVKHGAAFMRAGSLLWFMGKTLSGYLAFDSVGGLETISYEYANSHLTRTPEHDIKEGV